MMPADATIPCHQDPWPFDMVLEARANTVGEALAIKNAKAVCAGCSFKADCLKENEFQPGVWGGLSEAERKQLRKKADAA